MNRSQRRLQEKQNKKQLSNVNFHLQQAEFFFQKALYHKVIEHLQQVIKICPAHFLAWRNLGESFRRLGDRQKAHDCFLKTIELCPDFFMAYEDMGHLLWEIGDKETSILYLEEALKAQTYEGNALEKLAEIYTETQSFEKAKEKRQQLFECFEKKLSHVLTSKDVTRFLIVAKIFDEAAEFDKARFILEKLVEHAPSLETEFSYFIRYPPLLKSIQEETHTQILSKLKELQSKYQPCKGFPTHWTNVGFYSAYMKPSPKLLQETVATFFKTLYPDLLYTSNHIDGWKPPVGKIRLGICSAFLNVPNHSVARTTLDLIKGFSKDLFDITIFIVKQVGELVPALQDFSVISLPLDYDQARRLISDKQLDILFYPDLGMEPFTYFLAFSRLAPIQCVGPGHPITTGLSTIDYFLSNEELDTIDSQENYSERLIRLKGPITKYPELLTQDSYKDLGVAKDTPIYFCPQMLFKIHPQMDKIFSEILKRDPKAVLLLIESKQGWKRPMLDRLKTGYGFDRVIMLPFQPFDTFKTLLKQSHVVLDTFPFGSGNTAYHTLSVGTPFITKPEKDCRSRGTYSLYRLMGIEECIAKTEAEYIDLAVHYANNEQDRLKFREKVTQNLYKIFNSEQAVKCHSDFFQQIVSVPKEYYA
ncbi:MAG: tetratricopeptide repeat protein [Proteobacteria bacterium]|nr:tetratricopeptide repeat protein [Pseudomonadota bacterium]